MYLLHTGLVLEALQPKALKVVRDWLNQRPIETLFVTTYTYIELSAYWDANSASRVHMQRKWADLWEHRLVDLNAEVARSAREMLRQAREEGFDLSMSNAILAASAVQCGMVIAARDLRVIEAFDRLGVRHARVA